MPLTADFPKANANGSEIQIDAHFNVVFVNVYMNLVYDPLNPRTIRLLCSDIFSYIRMYSLCIVDVMCCEVAYG